MLQQEVKITVFKNSLKNIYINKIIIAIKNIRLFNKDYNSILEKKLAQEKSKLI